MSKTFRQTLALALAASVMLQSISTAVVAVYWQVNQDWIAKHLCEKRLEKGSCCAGSCQLKKWVGTVEKSPEQESSKLPSLPVSLKEEGPLIGPEAPLTCPFFVELKEARTAVLGMDERLPIEPFLEEIGKPPEPAA